MDWSVGDNSTLTGCVRGAFSTDDRAALSDRFDGSRIADGGFENTTFNWYRPATTRVSNFTFQGSWAIQFSNGGSLQQRVRVHGPALATANYTLRYKTTGTASRAYKGRWRTVDYPAGATTCGTSFWPPNDLNLDSTSPGLGAWTTITNNLAPSASWIQALAGGTQSLPAADAHDIETIIVNNGTGSLWVDNVVVN